MIKTLIFLFCTLLLEIIVFNGYIKILKRKQVTQSIRELGPKEHFKKTGTPTAGGCLIVIFQIINYIGIKVLNNKKANWFDFLYIITTLLFSIVGLLDDLKIIKIKNNRGLTPKIKLLLEVIFSLIISIMILGIFQIKTLNFFGININLKYLIILFHAFYIIAWSNSYNITDGLDGLASGLSFVLLVGIFIIGKTTKNELLVIGSLSIFFALVGFLIFNFHPAMVFMGNIGSHGLGASIAILGILSGNEVIFAVMGFIFIFETISVILQVWYFKKTHGQRLFKMAPFHHHLELTGYDEININYFLIGIEIIFVIIGLLLWGI